MRRKMVNIFTKEEIVCICEDFFHQYRCEIFCFKGTLITLFIISSKNHDMILAPNRKGLEAEPITLGNYRWWAIKKLNLNMGQNESSERINSRT